MSDAIAHIPLYEPYLGGNERAYVDECLRTNFVSSVGPFVDRFERELATYVGSKHAVACSTGTAALHVALRLLGIGPGDEVIVPTLTFVASAAPIFYEKAIPVFVDSERATWNLDPALVRQEMAARAKAGRKQVAAVMAVHLLGRPAQIEPIAAACEEFGVPLIEDAAEALGASYTSGRYAGKRVGTIGRIGCFSFNGNKLITAGGGGMIVTDDPALAKRAKHLTTQARLPGPEYLHDEVGYNYRLTNLAAAVGVAQLEQLPDFLVRKAKIAARYDEALRDVVDVPSAIDGATSSHWMYTVQLRKEDRRAAWPELERVGVHTRPIWTPLHRMAPFAGSSCNGGEVADDLFARSLSLPCSVNLSESDQARTITELRRVLASLT